MSEPITYDRANLLQKLLRQFAASGPGSWLFARILHRIDRPVHRLTGGRYTFASLVSGIPVVMLTTRGAKSGRPRTTPVLGIPTTDGVAIIASNFGQTHNPAWSHNLRAHPDAEVVIDGVRRPVRGVETEGDRRAGIWRAGLLVYPGFAQYERRAAHRHIAVFVLEPV
ncbi:MAG TPA: nitroreductase family deazaflavin-dependent oxidoreductase [Solirubrobacteraceae bacterium]|nr:nitroreductase family deazaflavin-dependent oxidoreductase [Solirubrobacteraceae bacterium]